MSSVTQRSFSAGEIAPALHARADLARYAIGLKTCRNMVVMRAGGVQKRSGTQFVDSGGSAGTSPAYLLTLTPAVSVIVGMNVGVVAVLTDWIGNPVTTSSCAFETDAAGTATVTATGPRTATVHGVANGVTSVRARITALDVVSNDCEVTVSDYYVLHAFVGDGTLTVTHAGTMDEILSVGGGGSGGSVDGTGVGCGGGGAGEAGVVSAVPVFVGVYTITVGGGGIAPYADHTIGGGVFGSLPGNNGSDTTISDSGGVIGRARGGGGGGDLPGLAGGSGGGGASWGGSPPASGAGGASTAVAPGVGHAGGAGIADGTSVGGGGGGGGSAGGLGTPGGGVSSSITGTAVVYATGGTTVSGNGHHGAAGAQNTGNGGDGGGPGLDCQGGNGGSGVVYFRYLASSGIVASGGIKTQFAV